jgi:hypothetical protein
VGRRIKSRSSHERAKAQNKKKKEEKKEMQALLQISAINGVTCGIYMGGRSSKVAPDRLGQ